MMSAQMTAQMAPQMAQMWWSQMQEQNSQMQEQNSYQGGECGSPGFRMNQQSEPMLPQGPMGAYPPMNFPPGYLVPAMAPGMPAGFAYVPYGAGQQDGAFSPSNMPAGNMPPSMPDMQWRDSGPARDGGQRNRVKRRQQRRRVEPVPPPRGLKVFVGGLGPQSTSDTLRRYFEAYGPVLDAAVLADSLTKRSRGFGFVEFEGEIPQGVLGTDHIIGERRCGVREYDYNPELA